MSTIWAILAVIVLVVFEGLVSSAEMVFFSLNEGLSQKLKMSQTKMARIYFELLAQPQKLFFTFSVVNILANTAVVVFSVYILNSLFFFRPLFFNLIFQLVSVCIFVLFFGKIMPRLVASHRPENNIPFSSYLMFVLIYVCTPLTWVLMRMSFLVKNIVQIPSNISLNDLSHAIEITGNAVADEKKLLKSILRFGNTESREIMRSRIDIVAVDQKESFASLLKRIFASRPPPRARTAGSRPARSRASRRGRRARRTAVGCGRGRRSAR